MAGSSDVLRNTERRRRAELKRISYSPTKVKEKEGEKLTKTEINKELNKKER